MSQKDTIFLLRGFSGNRTFDPELIREVSGLGWCIESHYR